MTTVYKNWITENQQAASRLMDEELDYWLAQVDHAPAAAARTGIAHTSTLRVPALAGLSPVDVQNRVMTALLFALYRLTGITAPVVFREGHGRNPLTHYDVSGAIGWFTCKYPTRYSIVQDSILETLNGIAGNNSRVPNGGVGFDVLRYFGPAYINRQLDRPGTAILFNYLGDISFTPQSDTQNDGLILSAHTGFSSTLEENAQAEGDGLFALNINAWIEDGFLSCRLDVAPTLGLDAPAAHRLSELAGQHLKELLSGDRATARIRVIPFQEGLISYVFSNPGSTNYINQNVFGTGADLDFGFFREVCTALTTKYEILRTCYSFDYATGEFAGTVLAPGTLNCDHYELDASNQEELAGLLSAIKQKGFAIDREPLIRFSLIRQGEKNIIVITSHHIIIDGTSVQYLLNELMTMAAELKAGRKVDTQVPQALRFSAYADWIASKDKNAAADYWKKLLTGAGASLLENHTAGEVNAVADTFGTVTHRFDIDEQAAGLLQGLHITLAAALNYLTGFVLARYAGRDAFVWGNTVTVRPFDIDSKETIVGPCIATIPVTADFTSAGTLPDAIRTLQLQLLESQEHAYLTLNDIARNAGQQQLFSASYVYQNFVTTAADAQQSGSYSAHLSEDGNISAHFPINVLVFEEGKSMTLRVKYRSDLFTARLISDICSAISTLFGRLASVKDTSVKDLDLFEVCGVQPSVLEGQSAEGAHTTLHDAFIRMAKTFPNKTAVIDGQQELSYTQLDALSNRICRQLLDERIAGAIGVRMKRSARLIAVILGILKSGSHVVSLEHDFPDEKISWIDKNVGLAAVFTDEEGSLPVAGRIFIVDAIEPLVTISDLPFTDPAALCCINYTSGSTGVPKLVKISHSGHANRVLWLRAQFPATDRDVYGFKTLLCFGPSLREVFEPLMQGATLYVYSNESNNHPRNFYEETVKFRVTRLFLTPTFLRLLYDFDLQEALATLVYLEISGEPIPLELYERLRASLPRTRIVGRYGATEAPGTVYHTSTEYTSRRHLPLGHPIFNTGISILNDKGGIVPAGIVGEIGIRGESISTGYVNRELEEGNFIEAAGHRHVKTGDLGYIDANGILVFQSRKTRMVKVKGYRVEPAEIEYNLALHPSVQKAIVVPVATAGTTRLTAFYIKKNVIEAGDLRAFLEQRLPRYMIPQEFTEISRLPLTDSGKVDYVSLSKYAVANAGAASRPPGAGTEQTVFDVIAEVVGHRDFDVLSNFLETGMDSILALKASYRLRKALGVEVDVTDIYMHPTVQDFSLLADRRRSGVEDESDQPYYFVNRRAGNRFLFFVPPIGNSQIDLKALEGAVPADVTLVIFKSITAEQTAGLTLEEVAAHYIQLLRTAYPGPKPSLSGWSLGATIAYEMAAQLERDGIEVGSVLLFDPGFHTPGYDEGLDEEKVRNIIKGLVGKDGDETIGEQVAKDIVSANRLIVGYEPSAYYGDIVLFKPEDIGAEERNYGQELNGLDEHCRGAIDVKRLPGNHMTMLNNVLQNRRIIEAAMQ